MKPITEMSDEILEMNLAVYEKDYKDARKKMEIADEHIRAIKFELNKRKQTEEESRPKVFLA